MLADLPGYGYARISKERKAEWRPLIEGYLRTSPELRGVVQLLDVRHDPTEDETPTVVVLTKIDKLQPRAAEARVRELGKSLHLDADQMIPFSAVTGAGRDELAEALVSLVEQR